MKRTIKIFAMVICISMLSVMLPGCSSSTSNTIKLGTIVPISGDISTYGIQIRDAIQMAIDDQNAKGGILGKKIELVAEDDENNPEKTANAFKKLVAKDKIIGLVGPITSKCTLAVTAEAQKNKVLLLTPTSTNDKVTDAGDYIFRSCYNDSFQGQVAAQFATQTLKAKNVAVIYDNSNDYSKGLTKNFSDKMQSLGGKVIANESYNSGDKDFKAQLTKIKSQNPEVLFIPDYYNTVALIAKQARELGITAPLLGPDGWDEITNNAGSEVENCYYVNHYSPEANDNEIKQFVSKYKEKYKGTTPNALAALAYDAAVIMINSIEKAGSTDSEKIKVAMAETNGKFVTGSIKFNEKHNPVKSAVILKIVKGADGKLTTTYAGTVNP